MKHVDTERYMGRLPVFYEIASTSDVAVSTAQRWKDSDIVEYAVLHNGVNDVTNGTEIATVKRNLQSTLLELKLKFPKAKIGFSEILYVSRGDRDGPHNEAIRKINAEMERFCSNNEMFYVSHPKLQSTDCKLFTDDKHIDPNGTAVLCSDIYRDSGYHGRGSGPRRPTQTFYNSNLQNRQLPPKTDNMNNLIAMLCMNMLQQYKS